MKKLLISVFVMLLCCQTAQASTMSIGEYGMTCVNWDGTLMAGEGWYARYPELAEIAGIREISTVGQDYVILRDDGTVATPEYDPLASSIQHVYMDSWDIYALTVGGQMFWYEYGNPENAKIIAENVVQAAICDFGVYVLENDGTVSMIEPSKHSVKNNTLQWQDIVQIAAGAYIVAGLRSDGEVVNSYQGIVLEKGIDTSKWERVHQIAVGDDYVLGLLEDGTVVSAGADGDETTKVSKWRNIIEIDASFDVSYGRDINGKLHITGGGISQQHKDEAECWTLVFRALKRNDSGDDVKLLQTQLIELGYLDGKADGSFGPRTESALMAFQKRHDLQVNGEADSETVSAIGKATRTTVDSEFPDGYEGEAVTVIIGETLESFYITFASGGVIKYGSTTIEGGSKETFYLMPGTY